MLKVRLQRVGRKHEPVFRVVVTDSHAGPKAGKAVEIVGSYDPRFNKADIKKERITHWMSMGAQLSPTLHNLLINEKVIEGKKINVLPRKAPLKKEGEEASAPVAPVAPVPTETPTAEIAEAAEVPAAVETPDLPETGEEAPVEQAEA